MADNNKIIWFDFTNVPHVSFLKPIIKHYQNYRHIYTLRDFAETRGLFEKIIGKEYLMIGEHGGQKKIMKVLSMFSRIYLLHKNVPKFDIKISVGGDASSLVAKLRGKVSITFDDNEKAPNWRYSKFSDLAIWPDCIDKKILTKQGFVEDKLYQYQGFKEDLYLADYKPDPNFLDSLPFKKYVVVRPENIQANYVGKAKQSIVPELLNGLLECDLNVLFLPRYKKDRKLTLNSDKIFIPKGAVNGLDACYYADAVFTGAGTMAREAACLGVPAFSFYAGKELLTVDKKMIELGWIFFSREYGDLIEKFLSSQNRDTDLERPKRVKKQILYKLDGLICS